MSKMLRTCLRLHQSRLLLGSRRFGTGQGGKARKQKVAVKTPQQLKAEEEKKRKAAEEKQTQAKAALENEREEYELSLRKFTPDAFYQGMPIAIPDLRRLFTEEEIQLAVKAIDTNSEIDIDSHPYRIFVSVILERSPILKPVLDHVVTYKEALTELKYHQNDIPPLVKELYSEKITARKKQLQLEEEKRIAEEDTDQCSLNRCFSERLYFVCKRKGQKFFEFPWTERKPEETLNDTSRRALYSRTSSGNLRYFQNSLGPIGHNQIEYGPKDQEKFGKKGAQVFFQRAFWTSGNARQHEMPAEVEQYAWVTKDELPEKLNPTLWKSVEDLLPA